MIFFEKRGLVEVALLTLFTFGIYYVYWSVVTGRELRRAGGNVPNAFLIIIPFASFYFWYMYAKSYVQIVRNSNDDMDVLVYFLLTLFPLLCPIVFQKGYNEYQD